ncbi:MAG: hypothetical protein ACI37Z_01185, partial [Candidatus Gastranaerophilaceae bacterium]
AFKYIQVFIGFYAFCNVLFWLAYSAKIVNQSSGMYLFFKPAWAVVNMFYTYKAVQGKEEVDFTGVVCAICLMLIAVVLKSVCEYLAELEENAKIEDQKRIERAQKKAMARANSNLKTKNVSNGTTSGFIFLLDIDIKQVSGFIQGASISPEEIAKIKANFFKSLLNNLNLNQVTQKGYYKKKLFLVYKNVSYFDDFIFYTRETLMSLSREFIRPSLRIDFLVSMNSIGQTEDFREKLDILDTINKLTLRNEFICTQALKDIYDTIPKHQYSLVSKGVYNLSKNLNISNHQEIFSLREGR